MGTTPYPCVAQMFSSQCLKMQRRAFVIVCVNTLLCLHRHIIVCKAVIRNLICKYTSRLDHVENSISHVTGKKWSNHTSFLHQGEYQSSHILYPCKSQNLYSMFSNYMTNVSKYCTLWYCGKEFHMSATVLPEDPHLPQQWSSNRTSGSPWARPRGFFSSAEWLWF